MFLQKAKQRVINSGIVGDQRLQGGNEFLLGMNAWNSGYTQKLHQLTFQHYFRLFERNFEVIIGLQETGGIGVAKAIAIEETEKTIDQLGKVFGCVPECIEHPSLFNDG